MNWYEELARLIEEDVNEAISVHQGKCVLLMIAESDDSIYAIVEHQGNCSGCSSTSQTLGFINSYVREEMEALGYAGQVEVITEEDAEGYLWTTET